MYLLLGFDRLQNFGRVSDSVTRPLQKSSDIPYLATEKELINNSNLRFTVV
jgi:hypothetical protein